MTQDDMNLKDKRRACGSSKEGESKVLSSTEKGEVIIGSFRGMSCALRRLQDA